MMLTMKNAVILHGTSEEAEYRDDKYPSLSNSHWLPWLQKKLLMNNIQAHTPEVFEAFEPTYEKWLKELSRYEISEKTILVGHSCGAGFLTRWLSENDVRVGKVILVAPWLDPDKSKSGDMFDFEIDPNMFEKASGIVVFHSDNDTESIQKSTKMIKEQVSNIKYKEFHNYGHFCFEDMGTGEFTELLDECLN